MKRKTIYLGAAVLTFILGLAFASLLVVNQQSVAEISISASVEPVSIKATIPENSINPVRPQKLSPQKTRHLAAIAIERFDPEFNIEATKFENLSDKSIKFDLELADSIENQIIALRPYPNDDREFKIEQQFETSMSLSDEGPHLDLTDWKHYTSEWQEIKKLEANKFLTSKIDESDYQKFPKVSREEIYKAVLKRGGKRWADHARSCENPTDGSCLVSVSRVSFRIKAKENGRWSVIHTINVFVPMGC